MQKPFTPAHPIPHVERPSEAVVYWTLENLCGGAGGRYMLPLARLARQCGLSVNTTRRALLRLHAKGWIVYRPGKNQFHPTIYEISTGGGANLSPRTSADAKTAMPIPSDSDNNINNLYTGDISDRGNVFHTKQDENESDRVERLACLVADGLGDRKNLALYRSYCKRFPASMILKAYIRAKEPAPEKIKKSRGALFNFLVQRFQYGEKQTQKDDSGDQAG